MVVDEGVEVRSAQLAGLGGVRQPGPHQHVGLPEVVRKVGLVAVQVAVAGLGLRPPGQPVGLQGPVQGAAGHDTGLDQGHVGEDLQDAVQGPLRDLLLQVAQQRDLLRGQDLHALGGEGLVGQGVEATEPVAADPGAQGLSGEVDLAAIGQGPGLRRQLVQQGAALTARRVLCEVGADRREAQQRHGSGGQHHVLRVGEVHPGGPRGSSRRHALLDSEVEPAVALTARIRPGPPGSRGGTSVLLPGLESPSRLDQELGP